MKWTIVISVMLALLHSANGQCADNTVTNCDKCDNPGATCQSCADGFILSKDKKSCVDCPANCVDCEREADDTLTCTECSSGYLSEGECKPCTITNCVLCMIDENDVEKCTLCSDPGYSGDQCAGCPDGKYLDGTSCKSCPSNAAKCGSGGTVIACNLAGVRYVKASDSASCISCPSGCVKCALNDAGDAGVCTECPVNEYVDDNGNCDYCGDDNASTRKCKVCGDTGVCEECNTRYALQSDECESCEGNCDVCPPDDNDKLTCSDCSEQYGLNKDVICAACPSKCKECTISTGACTVCLDGYYLDSGKCKACPARCGGSCDAKAGTCTGKTDCSTGAGGIADCATCNIAANNSVTCVTCNNGSEANTVSSKITSCVRCTDTTKEGNANCKTCTASDNADATVTCTACDDGYALNNNTGTFTCALCSKTGNGGVTNCAACDAGDDAAATVTCTKCDDGYALNTNGATLTCELCSKTGNGGVTNCVACDAGNDAAATVTCTKCDDGYALNNDTGTFTCALCTNTDKGGIANCATCTASGDAAATVACDTCATGYDLYTDGSTKSCVSCTSATTGGEQGCTACTASARDTVMCTECGDVPAIGGKCSGCPSNCDGCGTDVNTCVTCHKGFSRKYDTAGTAVTGCTRCPSNCKTCTSVSTNVQSCVTCVDEFVQVNGACEACPANCKVCSDASTCTTCLLNFGKDAEGNCVDCIANCEVCPSPVGETNDCTTCSDGYGRSSAQCTPCSANCIDCTYNDGAMDCDKCRAEYVLTGGVCSKCPSSCSECSSPTKCNKGKCTVGAVGDDGSCVDCPTLTGIPNCATCEEKANSNSSAKCLTCNAGFTLKDELQYGEDAECISVSDLNCGVGIGIADKASQCEEGHCAEGLIMTADYLCGRRCHVCGSVEDNTFVNMADCDTTNATGITMLCPSGYCYMLSRDDGTAVMVMAGCPQDLTKCDDMDPCTTANGVEECEQCCDNAHECTKAGLENGLKNGNGAPAAVTVNFALLLVSSVLAIMLLRVANN